jgi:hypothetical protein
MIYVNELFNFANFESVEFLATNPAAWAYLMERDSFCGSFSSPIQTCPRGHFVALGCVEIWKFKCPL